MGITGDSRIDVGDASAAGEARVRSSFDAIRLFAAFGVLVGHHFLVAGRSQPTLGAYGEVGPFFVFMFFAVSGYFIAASWGRDPNLARYWMRRALRIFPALAVTVALTVIAIGPLLTSFPVSDYAAASRTWSYLFNAALVLGIQYDLPGVFVTNVTEYVNLSLWSLPIELAMYTVLAITAFLFPTVRRLLYPVLAVVLGLAWFISPAPDGYALTHLFGLGATFFVGATIREHELLERITIPVIVASVLTLAAASHLDEVIARPMLWVLLPIAVLGIGARPSAIGAKVAGAGDVSYGVYLWAFPIQQIVVRVAGESLGFIGSMIVAGVITGALAIASMKWVEVPALRLRPRRPSVAEQRDNLPSGVVGR